MFNWFQKNKVKQLVVLHIYDGKRATETEILSKLIHFETRILPGQTRVNPMLLGIDFSSPLYTRDGYPLIDHRASFLLTAGQVDVLHLNINVLPGKNLSEGVALLKTNGWE